MSGVLLRSERRELLLMFWQDEEQHISAGVWEKSGCGGSVFREYKLTVDELAAVLQNTDGQDGTEGDGSE